jgi:hypothetical protein
VLKFVAVPEGYAAGLWDHKPPKHAATMTLDTGEPVMVVRTEDDMSLVLSRFGVLWTFSETLRLR